MDLYNRSLFIVSTARSGSTLTCRLASEILPAFRCEQEVLNHITHKVPFKWHAPLKEWHLLDAELKKYRYRYLIKDVIQTEYIIANMKKIINYYNILFLSRPIGQIFACRSLLRWTFPERIKNLYFSLECIAKEFCQKNEQCEILSYKDLLFNPNRLNNILTKWYPSETKYIKYDENRSLLNKRKSVIQKLGLMLLYRNPEIPEAKRIYSLLALQDNYLITPAELQEVYEKIEKYDHLLHLVIDQEFQEPLSQGLPYH